MVTAVVSEEVHLTILLRSWVLLSVNVPMAVNCSEEPKAMLGLVGVT